MQDVPLRIVVVKTNVVRWHAQQPLEMSSKGELVLDASYPEMQIPIKK